MFPDWLRRPFHVLLLLISTVLASACGSSSEIVRPSTYVGSITSTHLNELYLAEAGGQQLGFDEVFHGYEPQRGLFTETLPFPKAAVADIVYRAAESVAEYYDSKANNNGYLEGPELLVLYVRESAIGLGHSVEYIGTNPPVNALATSNADIGGLMVFVRTNVSKMSDEAQAIFRDLERMGLDWKSRGKSGGGGSGR